MRIRSKQKKTRGSRHDQACYLSSYQLKTEYSQLSKLEDGQRGKEKAKNDKVRSLFISDAWGIQDCKRKQEKTRKIS